jgi:YspA, cpYpsA-related SLOG family
MRTIIAGSRDITEDKWLKLAISLCGWKPTVVLCGGARGADAIGKDWAEANDIPVEIYPAKWDKYKFAAGPIRNEKMARKAEALIALWDGKSAGTKNMIKLGRKYKLRVFVQRCGGQTLF